MNLIVGSGKSEAEVTIDKRLHSRYCTAEGSVARPLYDSRSTCFV